MKTKTVLSSISILSIISIIVLTSCNSHEQNVDGAFEQVKEEKMMAKDSFTISKETVLESPTTRPVNKNENQDEWKKFKTETEKKILANENKIKEIKSIPDSNTKLYKQVSSLEKDNNDLRKQMDEYQEEMKMKWESFKLKINHDVNEIEIELKDMKLNNKK